MLKELASMREYLDIKTKKIIWLFYEGNDLSELVGKSKNQILINYVQNKNYSQKLKNKQKYIDNIVTSDIKAEEIKYKYKTNYFKSSILLHNTRNIINAYVNILCCEKYIDYKSETLSDKNFKLVSNILSQAKSISTDLGADLYFVYIPERNRYEKKVKYINKNYKNIINIVDDLDIKIIDLHKEFFENKKNPIRFMPGHFSIKGYEEVTKKILEFTN